MYTQNRALKKGTGFARDDGLRREFSNFMKKIGAKSSELNNFQYWESMLQKSIKFIRIHGRRARRTSVFYEERSIGNWINHQQTIMFNGQLSPERKELF